jgi:hypothetical protein
MILYKYTTRYALKKILTNSSLIVRPINEYNDPFESVPIMTEENMLHMAEKMLERSNTLHLLENDEEINPEHYNAIQLRIMLRDPEFRREIILFLKERSQVQPVEFALAIQEMFSRHLGLVCLTDDPANLLMWSHYAESHFGYVIALETKKWIGWEPIKVKYARSRVSFADKEPTNDELKEMLSTKAVEWEYESEYRIICSVEKWIESELGHSDTLKLMPDQILGICAGIRTEEADILQVQKILSSTKRKNVNLFKAKLNTEKFSIVIPLDFRFSNAI